MISGKEDVIKVTIDDPAVLDKWLGSQWWWKQMMDPKGNWLRAFVMFGDREVMTPEQDQEGNPVFRKVVDQIVQAHFCPHCRLPDYQIMYPTIYRKERPHFHDN